jgi:hypothetical protein
MFNPDPKALREEKKRPVGFRQQYSGTPIKARVRHDMPTYESVKKEYLKDNQMCECGCGQRSVLIHHKKGRVGGLLCDPEFFMAVAYNCHVKIHNEPKEACEKGYLLPRNN